MIKNLKIRNRFKALTLTAIMILTTPTLVSCSKKGNEEKTTSNTVSSYTSVNYNKFEDLMAALPDGIKKENLQNVYNVLYKLNGEIANSVKDKSDGDKLFQMDWDTIQALVLASNDYTSKEMIEIFDEYNYNKDYLCERYKNFSSIFIPLGERLTTPTGLDVLIKDEKQKEIFSKYEAILIEINQTRNDNNETKLKSLYNKAFGYIREDFLIKDGGSAFANPTRDNNENTGYYSLIVPYINTIIELGRNDENKLNKNEMKELNSNGICNNALASIEDNLEGYRNRADVLDTIDLAGTYEEARSLAIKDLTNQKLYFIDWENSTLPILSGEKLVYNTIETTNNYTISTNTKTKKKTDTRKYNDIKDLKANENKDVVDKAEQGKKEVDEKINRDNEKAKQEAEKEAEEKASKESEKNKEDNDKKMEEKKEEAKVIDKNGNVDEDKKVVQPDNKNEVIEEVKQDRDYDGPTYDKDGNIIATGCIKVLTLHL